MMQARLMNILRAPVLTEKSELLRKSNTTVFKVLPDATKAEIKQAVETLFNVKVEKVHTCNVQGKKRRSAHGIGVRSDWKKAYVTLAQNSAIDVTNGLADKESN